MNKRWASALVFVGLLSYCCIVLSATLTKFNPTDNVQSVSILSLYRAKILSQFCIPATPKATLNRVAVTRGNPAVLRGGRRLSNKSEEQRPSLLLVDAGGNFDGENRLDELRARANMEAMKAMGYDAILFTPAELRFGTDFPTQIATELQLPFISTTSSPLQGSRRCNSARLY